MLQRFRINILNNKSLSIKLILISCLMLVFYSFIEFEYCHMDYFFTPHLLTIDNILKAHDIQGFVAFGALLGLIRAGKLMPWDYDVDLGIHGTDAQRLLSPSLKQKFQRLRFEVYGRNEFIWHKWGGHMFQINDPILRLYTPPSPVLRYTIEFYEYDDVTLASAKFGFPLFFFFFPFFLLNIDSVILCIF